MEEADDLWQMEAELPMAVVVTITGTRPEVRLEAAAAALHEEFRIGPADMSIQAYYPEDFLVLCREQGLCDRMVCQGGLSLSSSTGFSLSLRPWLRQAQATGTSLPFLVPLALVGMPAHTWTRRTANSVLRGLGLVVGVVDSTAHRHDMSSYKVWLRTDRSDRIPSQRWLYIEEPRRGRHTYWACTARSSALWYNVRIIKLAGPVIDDEDDLEPSPPPSLPGPPSGAGDDGLDEGHHDHRGTAGGRRNTGAAGGSPPSAGVSSSDSAPASGAGQIQNKAGWRNKSESDERACQAEGPTSQTAEGRILTTDAAAPTPGQHVERTHAHAVVEIEASLVDRSGANQPASSCALGQGVDQLGLAGCAPVGLPLSVTLSRWRKRTDEAEQQMAGSSTADAAHTGWRVLVGSVELSVGPGSG